MADNPVTAISKMLTQLTPIPTDAVPEMETPGKIRAVLFDIYGTLLISGTGDISLASPLQGIFGMKEILAKSGFTTSFERIGDTISDLLERSIRERHEELHQIGVDYPEVDIRDIWKKVLAALWIDGQLDDNPSGKPVDLLALRYELAVNPVWPMPGFPEIVGRLRKAGYLTGIVSNAQFYTALILEAITDKSLEQLGFGKNLCAWSYELSRSKPSPEVFRGPLAELSNGGIFPSEVLYVGNDMLNDVTAASDAGCRTALFAGDRRSLRLREGDKRVDVEPDMIITELSQLDTLIPKGASHGKTN